MSNEPELKVLYEDDHLAVFDKPSGVVVNESATTGDFSTVQSLIADKWGKAISQGGILGEGNTPGDADEFVKRAGIVHRLDKGTSGVLIVAKDSKTFFDLQKQFKDRAVHKEYVVLVLGRVGEDNFEIDAPIGRNPKNKFRFAVVHGGKEAQTRFSVDSRVKLVAELPELTLLKCFPVTGRTHQIRVHLAAANHPVVGDAVYCSTKQLEATGKYFDRMMLHAAKIKFQHPTTGSEIEVESPLPQEFDVAEAHA